MLFRGMDSQVRLTETDELSESERTFRQKRAPLAMKAIRELLGEERGPKSIDETPTIALAISGGGYRAVSTSCGAMEAMMENKLFDALMYCAGLSGSVWYLATTYVRQSFSDLKHLTSEHDWIRGQLGKKFKFNVELALVYLFKDMIESKKLSLVNLYGVALRDIFLPEHENAKLSSLQDYVNEAKVPFLILSAAHVRNHYPTVDFWEELEFTPFEATYATYRRMVPIKHLNSVWKDGILSEVREEPSLHYMMGICGSAFAILLYHLPEENEATQETFRDFVKHAFQDFGKSLKRGKFDHTPEGSDQTSFAERDPPMTKEEFETNVWPVLDKAATEAKEEITLEEAYRMYLYRYNSPDYEWIEDLMLKAGIDAKKKKITDFLLGHLGVKLFKASANQIGRTGRELIGRNIGPLRRTGFLSNPLLGMPKSIKKDMMDDQSIAARKQDASERIHEKDSTVSDHILVVDEGLGCNVPAIYVARPQRKVDVILVVDCEVKSTNLEETFETLTVLKKEMSDNNMKFPTIDIEKLKQDPVREYYLFEDPDDPDCPVVIWFTLYNVRFRELVNAPLSHLYPASEYHGNKFNEFSVSPAYPQFHTTNLDYHPRTVDRLRELMKFNIGTNMQVVKEKIAGKVQHLRSKRSNLRSKASGCGGSSRKAAGGEGGCSKAAGGGGGYSQTAVKSGVKSEDPGSGSGCAMS